MEMDLEKLKAQAKEIETLAERVNDLAVHRGAVDNKLTAYGTIYGGELSTPDRTELLRDWILSGIDREIEATKAKIAMLAGEMAGDPDMRGVTIGKTPISNPAPVEITRWTVIATDSDTEADPGSEPKTFVECWVNKDGSLCKAGDPPGRCVRMTPSDFVKLGGTMMPNIAHYNPAAAVENDYKSLVDLAGPLVESNPQKWTQSDTMADAGSITESLTQKYTEHNRAGTAA